MVKLSNHILRHRRLFPCLIVFLIISVSQLLVSSPLYAASQEKNLLIINSYNESAPWVQSYITPFMLEAANNDQLNCNLVHMNSTLVRTDSMYYKIENGVFDRFKHGLPCTDRQNGILLTRPYKKRMGGYSHAVFGRG